jgi:hypothetical protein
MNSERVIRRARTEKTCSEHSYHLIRPGDLYLAQRMAPWHDMNQTKKWVVLYTCLRCAEHYGLMCSDNRQQLADYRNVTRTPDQAE